MKKECRDRPSPVLPVPPPELVGLLRSSLGKRYGDPHGWSLELISEQGRPGRERRLLRARHSASGRSVAIKQNSAPAHNKRQYRALRNLRRVTEECVSPHYISEDARFFVMDWVDVPLMMERLAGSERQGHLARMGSWLARIQSATRRHPLLVRKPYIFREPEGDNALTTSIHERLRARLALVSYRDGPITMIHGDLHPGNVFVTDRGVVVFDRKLDRYGTPFIDVAAFLISVGHLRALAADAGQPWSGDEEEDRRHFFEGFGAIRESDLALYDLIEDITIFQRWLKHGGEEDPWFDQRLQSQGLFEPTRPSSRPGRMVVAAAGGGAYWSEEPAPPPRRGLVRHAALRLGLPV